MFRADFLRTTLGHWDSVRFAADGEMLERVGHILGGELVKARELSMFCLSSASSLTRDPAHGISGALGPSPVRRMYRDAWRAWHATLSRETAYLPFPQGVRPFMAPEACRVPDDVVRRAVREATEGLAQ
jgi:hypothetical protein